MAADQSIVSNELNLTVNRPADDVFRYLTNPANVPQWSGVVSEVEQLPAGHRVDAGTKLRANLDILGMKVTVDGEVVAFDPARRRATVLTRVHGGGTVETQFAVDEREGQSTVRFQERVTPPGWLVEQGIGERLIRCAIEAAEQFSVATIKGILENADESRLANAQAYASKQRLAEPL
jgi:uncharacterized protein YndB with AHSA1/START domain